MAFFTCCCSTDQVAATELSRDGEVNTVNSKPPFSEAPTEEEQSTAKARLQRLIRDFARHVVGPGIEVEAQVEDLIGKPGASETGAMKGLLRMDRRLSRVEVWPPGAQQNTPREGTTALMILPLQQVSEVAKETPGTNGMTESPESRSGSLLVLPRHHGEALRLNFESERSRDRAFTCLKIFLLSIDQSSLEQGDPGKAVA